MNAANYSLAVGDASYLRLVVQARSLNMAAQLFSRWAIEKLAFTHSDGCWRNRLGQVTLRALLKARNKMKQEIAKDEKTRQ